MKKIVSMLIGAAVLFGLTSCGPTKEYSGDMNEKAIIISMIYSPSVHETKIEPTMAKMGGKYGGLGIGYSGEQGMRIGKNMQITESTIPEQFGVVFQCQHGTFTIQGPGVIEGQVSKYKVLYDKLNGHRGDTVNVIYQEIYNVTYKKQDGKKVEDKRVLVDLHFIDAQLLH